MTPSPGSASGWPDVAVVMPIRNEARHLVASIDAVLRQRYPGQLQVVLAVGPSSDDTATIAAALTRSDPRVRVVDNPTGRTSAGLNLAVAAATAQVIVRVDGHALLPQGYVRRAVELLEETGAVNVGGVMAAEGETAFERAVAAAMTSRFGVGDAKFHYGGSPGPVDTVYLGVFEREALERAGGFDESLVRSQDAEMNYRLRENGGTVFFHPDLRVAYRPRGTIAALARQYFEYGRYRRVVLRLHPRSLRWRQLVPPVALVGNAAGLAVGALLHPAGLLVPAGYLAALITASLFAGRRLPAAVVCRLPAVFATMHLAWAIGFLTSPRHLARRNPPAQLAS